jgi:hypothetical protein
MEPRRRAWRLTGVTRPVIGVVAASVLGCVALALSGCTSAASPASSKASSSPSLVTPPSPPPTSSCGQYGLYAETTAAYRYLLSCSSGTMLPVPTVPVAVGSVVEVAGFMAAQVQLSLPPHQAVARLDGDTITGLAAGQVVVTARGLDCYTGGASQPVSCPLMTIAVR